MPGEFTVDVESFTPLAAAMRTAAQDLRTAWQPVSTQSTAVHYGRGDDLLSPLVQAAITEAVQLLDECVTSSAEALDGYGEGLDLMGKLYGDAETDTVTTVSAQK